MKLEAFQTTENSPRTCWNRAKGCGQEWEKVKLSQRKTVALTSEESQTSHKGEKRESMTGKARHAASMEGCHVWCVVREWR